MDTEVDQGYKSCIQILGNARSQVVSTCAQEVPPRFQNITCPVATTPDINNHHHTHHICFQRMGNADYSPHLPTTNTPPPQHPLQRGTQCRSATYPPSTPHAPPSSMDRSVVQQPAHHQHPMQHSHNKISRPQLLCMEHRVFIYLSPPTPHASSQYSHSHQSINSPFCFAGVKPQPFTPALSSTNRLI